MCLCVLEIQAKHHKAILCVALMSLQSILDRSKALFGGACHLPTSSRRCPWSVMQAWPRVCTLYKFCGHSAAHVCARGRCTKLLSNFSKKSCILGPRVPLTISSCLIKFFQFHYRNPNFSRPEYVTCHVLCMKVSLCLLYSRQCARHWKLSVTSVE